MKSPFLVAQCGCIYLRVEYGMQILVEHCKWSEEGPQLIFSSVLTTHHHLEGLAPLEEQEHNALVERIHRACIQAYQWQRMADVIALGQTNYEETKINTR